MTLEISKQFFKEPPNWTKMQKIDSTDDVHINIATAIENIAKCRMDSTIPEDLKILIPEQSKVNSPKYLQEFKDEQKKAVDAK